MKVLSYCISRGRTAGRTVSKIRKVDQKCLGEFIDIKEAYQRIRAFVTTSEFLLLQEDEQMDAVAFLLAIEHKRGESIIEDCISDEIIRKELRKIIDKG